MSIIASNPRFDKPDEVVLQMGPLYKRGGKYHREVEWWFDGNRYSLEISAPSFDRLFGGAVERYVRANLRNLMASVTEAVTQRD